MVVSIARQIARHALGLRFDDLPQEVVHQTKRVLLDTLACAIGGYDSHSCQIAQALVKELGGHKEATVIGSGLKTSCMNAALVNGLMVRYLDSNDIYAVTLGPMISGHHPSELIPGALAVGERQCSSGKEIIAAIVLGYEISDRFCDSVTEKPLPNRGWHHGTIGPYVMPVVASKLLGLDEAQMENAIGISGTSHISLGIVDATGEEYNMTKNIVFPFAAERGILAALLAQKGFTGPGRVMEGNKGFAKVVMDGDCDFEKLTNFGDGFRILQTTMKCFAADGTTQGHLTATQELVRKHSLKAEDIVRVRIRAGRRCAEHTGDPVKRYPTNKETADHSSYYLAAMVILEGGVGPSQFAEPKYRDPRVRELIDKVTIEGDPQLDELMSAGIVEIATKKGDTYTCRIDYPRGHYRNPLTDGEIEDKLRSMASRFMAEERIRKVIDAVYGLDKADDIGRLMRLLVFKD